MTHRSMLELIHRLRPAALAALLAGLQPISFASANEPWLSFNGYAAGMSKAAAKKLGYQDCKSPESGPDLNVVTCTIPQDKWKFEGLAIKSAELVFLSKKPDRVSGIRVSFNAKSADIEAAARKRFGAPAGRDGFRALVWMRDTAPETLELPLRSTSSELNFKFDPDLPSRVAKAKATEKAREDKLKNF